MLQFGLRLGHAKGVKPRKVVTTTPKPTKIVKEVAKDPTTFITRGSTFDNAGNLAESFLNQIRSKYEGTRLGRQELYAEILDDNPGALWNRGLIDANRIADDKLPELRRIVVAIDPSATSGEESDETGIIVAGLGVDGLGYVLDDVSMRDKPIEWAKAAIKAYRDRNADRIIAEVNNGGEMVEAVIRQVDANCSYRAVRASKGKQTRAEPISALYEQGRIKHVGHFGALEDQMCDWDPVSSSKSPDRMDALVWAFTELMVENNGTGILDYYANKAIGDEASRERLSKAQEKLAEIFGKKG
jgi:phage terminase large subunit-like protein